MFSKICYSTAVCITAILFGALTAMAEEHKILGGEGNTWEWKGNKSRTNGTPLTISVSIGDELEFEVVAGTHSFVTLAGPGSPGQTVDEKFVLRCGEQLANKPDAVLRELGPCIGGQSSFDKPESVSAGASPKRLIRLYVMSNFSNDINFWCNIHKQTMWGIIKKQ